MADDREARNARRDNQGRLIPTGDCWCGCGAETRPGAFFVPSHDRVAEAAVIRAHYGSIPEFLVAHGGGPPSKDA
jgi:hypothetical protein